MGNIKLIANVIFFGFMTILGFIVIRVLRHIDLIIVILIAYYFIDLTVTNHITLNYDGKLYEF